MLFRSQYSAATSAITSDIYISSGFTFNLYYKDTIDRLDIIDNIVNYSYDIVDIDINKYMLNILIANSGDTIADINNTGEYCVKISISDKSNNEVVNYFIMNTIYDITGSSFVVYNPFIVPVISGDSSGTTIIIFGIDVKPPIIYYNQPISGTSWIGSGTTTPYDVFLHLIHDNLTGWTLDSLKYLFISGVTDCFDGKIPLSAVTFLLFNNGSNIPLTGITHSGIYNVIISFTDSANNNITNYISNIVVDDDPPIIVYRPYVMSSGLTGYTTNYTCATSAITSGIYISSGFTFNLGGFDQNVITRLDIIDNVVNYVYDNVDTDINKYMIEILIAGSSNSCHGCIVYSGITQPGIYCVKVSLSDSSGNKIINYFMMFVTYDVSVYSEGYWQDNKVWVDFVLWLDHPIIPER